MSRGFSLAGVMPGANDLADWDTQSQSALTETSSPEDHSATSDLPRSHKRVAQAQCDYVSWVESLLAGEGERPSKKIRHNDKAATSSSSTKRPPTHGLAGPGRQTRTEAKAGEAGSPQLSPASTVPADCSHTPHEQPGNDTQSSLAPDSHKAFFDAATAQADVYARKLLASVDNLGKGKEELRRFQTATKDYLQMSQWVFDNTTVTNAQATAGDLAHGLRAALGPPALSSMRGIVHGGAAEPLRSGPTAARAQHRLLALQEDGTTEAGPWAPLALPGMAAAAAESRRVGACVEDFAEATRSEARRAQHTQQLHEACAPAIAAAERGASEPESVRFEGTYAGQVASLGPAGASSYAGQVAASRRPPGADHSSPADGAAQGHTGSVAVDAAAPRQRDEGPAKETASVSGSVGAAVQEAAGAAAGGGAGKLSTKDYLRQLNSLIDAQNKTMGKGLSGSTREVLEQLEALSSAVNRQQARSWKSVLQGRT